MRRFSLACLLAGLVVESGCGKEPVQPAITDVSLGVTTTPDVGGPTAPITMRSRATNAGNTRVWICSGCGCEDFGFRVLGPDGHQVALHDPNAVGPMCPAGWAQFEPSENLETTDTFAGLLYERDSPTRPTPTYPAPPGTYTVIAFFAYAPTQPGEGVTVESKTSFVWTP
jgi:hypothetical protein